MSIKLVNPIFAGSQSRAAFDLDALAYISAVEQEDGQTLELAIKTAINNFVVGCKSDGIWGAIKSSCILAGARTLDGALVPLVGSGPTSLNFVTGDYSRATGLVGDASTKYLNSNRADNASPQNSNHASVYATVAPTVSANLIGGGGATGTSFTQLFSSTTFTLGPRNRDSGASTYGASALVGFAGCSRSDSASYAIRYSGIDATVSAASVAPSSNNLFVFARNNNGTAGNYTNARLGFYSIGESLDLALLDARVTSLINAIGTAIP